MRECRHTQTHKLFYIIITQKTKKGIAVFRLDRRISWQLNELAAQFRNHTAHESCDINLLKMAEINKFYSLSISNFIRSHIAIASVTKLWGFVQKNDSHYYRNLNHGQSKNDHVNLIELEKSEQSPWVVNDIWANWDCLCIALHCHWVAPMQIESVWKPVLHRVRWKFAVELTTMRIDANRCFLFVFKVDVVVNFFSLLVRTCWRCFALSDASALQSDLISS